MFVTRLQRASLVMGIVVALLCSPSFAHACTPGDYTCDPRQVHNSSKGVRGTAIVVADGSGGVRKVAGSSSCSSCAWDLVPECAYHPNIGGPKDETDACNSGSGVFLCRLSTGLYGTPYRRLFSSTGINGPWAYAGRVCLGENDKPVSIESLFAQVRLFVDQLVPAAPRVGMQPNGVAIVNLPALFQAGQATDPGNRPTNKIFFATAGASIAINVTVHPEEWTWTISDVQSATVSRDYCCHYYTAERSPRAEPDYYASYNFTATGSHTATVAVTWNATMTIAGLGTVPVDGTFTRTSPAYAFIVKQAVSQLESGY